ncbi:hypothetical protein M2325_001272 [Methanococcus voltae PS]|uniref:Uncharacterized protein n=1 Tax=Methanococcus voltae PS TaxID=523842 RepID=A0ABT2EX94_METVO|nr:hypothetical protein [Methanococcus voltae]MCS3922576.1 hypothetical protein [Methanococcus voltae PS]
MTGQKNLSSIEVNGKYMDFYNILSEFLDTHKKLDPKLKKDESTFYVKSIVEDNRYITGIGLGGTTNSGMGSVDKKTSAYEDTNDKLISEKLNYVLYVPKNKDYALILLEKRGNSSFLTVFRDNLKKYLKEVVKLPNNIIISQYATKNLCIQSLEDYPMDSLEVSKKYYPKDKDPITKYNIGRITVKIEGIEDKTLILKKIQEKALEDLRNNNINVKNLLDEIPEELNLLPSADTVSLVQRICKETTKKISFKGNKCEDINAYYNITEEVGRDEIGNPTSESLVDLAKECMEDLVEDIENN